MPPPLSPPSAGATQAASGFAPRDFFISYDRHGRDWAEWTPGCGKSTLRRRLDLDLDLAHGRRLPFLASPAGSVVRLAGA